MARKVKMFEKILIANRGEIACRVIRTARKMGIATVAVYSDADRSALHVREADEAVYIGEAPSSESYLCSDKIIRAALDTGAQGIHPGYGFLSENAGFAKDCAKAGLVFIGPPPEAIEAMGLKDRAKAIMDKAGVPTVPGYYGDNQSPDFLAKEAAKIGYPVLIKAVAGGGGKGMRIVEKPGDFAESLASCQREAKAAFGNDLVLVEKYLTKPRHIEVQVFGDSHGNIVHLFERDCSLQRRYQKVVEEAPAPGLPHKMREAMGVAAVKAAQAIFYQGAGTVEFITEGPDFYFMEMNTRLQVEHPVTEEITGLDLVEWQLRVAAGEKLPKGQKEIAANGHAFEVRLYAEDPAAGFLPQTGRITHFSIPDEGRIDTGVEAGDSVSIHYDPMIAKLVTWGKDRDEAARKMQNMLHKTHLCGLPANQEFLAAIFAHKDFLKGEVDTGFISRNEEALLPESYGRPDSEDLALVALHCALGLDRRAAGGLWDSRDHWRMGGGPVSRTLHFINRGEKITLNAQCSGKAVELEDPAVKAILKSYSGVALTAEIGGQDVAATIFAHKKQLTLFREGRVIALERYSPENAGEEGAGDGRILAPMPGRIVKLLAQQGECVEKGQPLIIMESMKVEITIRARCAGLVRELAVSANDQVTDSALLLTITPQEELL